MSGSHLMNQAVVQQQHDGMKRREVEQGGEGEKERDRDPGTSHSAHLDPANR